MLIRTKWRLCMSWRHFGWTLWRSQLLCSWRNFYFYKILWPSKGGGKEECSLFTWPCLFLSNEFLKWSVSNFVKFSQKVAYCVFITLSYQAFPFKGYQAYISFQRIPMKQRKKMVHGRGREGTLIQLDLPLINFLFQINPCDDNSIFFWPALN